MFTDEGKARAGDGRLEQRQDRREKGVLSWEQATVNRLIALTDDAAVQSDAALACKEY